MYFPLVGMFSPHISTWETFTHPVGPANMSFHSFEDLTYISGKMLNSWSMNKTESLSNDPRLCTPLHFAPNVVNL